MNNENNTPVNKTAALVMSKGTHYLYENKGVNVENENYIEFSEPDHQKLSCPEFYDFTGFKKGRLLVLGLYNKPKRWVCKCSCGTYTVRTVSALRNERNDDDCCTVCRNTKYLQNKHVNGA